MLKRSIVALAVLLVLSAPLVPAHAQAGTYPAMQPTRVVAREYNFAVADFDGGSAVIFQWREGMGDPKMQFTADLGLADVADNSGLILGGSLHYQLRSATADLPFDMVLGGGIGLTAYDNGRLFRIPFGVAIGHRFPLEGGYAVSPFVHPRISIDRFSGGGASASETNLDVDLGASFELNPRMQVRLAATIGEFDGVAISFAWQAKGMR